MPMRLYSSHASPFKGQRSLHGESLLNVHAFSRHGAPSWIHGRAVPRQLDHRAAAQIGARRVRRALRRADLHVRAAVPRKRLCQPKRLLRVASHFIM